MDVAHHRPRGIPKLEWSASPNRTRSIDALPMIGTDIFHPGRVSLSPVPELLLVSASAGSQHIANSLLTHTQSLAVSHGIPAVLCSASTVVGQEALSGAVDEWGRVLHLQAGGSSFVTHMALPYRGGARRMFTNWERAGSSGILGLWATFFGLGKAVAMWSGEEFDEHLDQGEQNLILETDSAGYQDSPEGKDHSKKRLTL